MRKVLSYFYNDKPIDYKRLILLVSQSEISRVLSDFNVCECASDCVVFTKHYSNGITITRSLV